jgi:hypothetical protein
VTAIDWLLLATLAYAGAMALLFAVLRAAGTADDAADRALLALQRQQRLAALHRHPALRAAGLRETGREAISFPRHTFAPLPWSHRARAFLRSE